MRFGFVGFLHVGSRLSWFKTEYQATGEGVSDAERSSIRMRWGGWGQGGDTSWPQLGADPAGEPGLGRWCRRWGPLLLPRGQ